MTKAAPTKKIVERMPILVATMAWEGGMGRFASELTQVLAEGESVTLVAPKMDLEPQVSERIVISQPKREQFFLIRIAVMIKMNFQISFNVWKKLHAHSTFLLIDLHPFIPFSFLPALIASFKGAKVSLNLHDFYAHRMRYPYGFHWLEKSLRRWIYRRFDQIFAMTDVQVSRLSSEAKVAPSRITRIDHGPFVVEGILPPSANENATIMLFGAVRANKRIKESLLAYKELKAERVKLNLRVCVTPHREEGSYWHKCAEILDGLPDVEVRVGFVPEEELPIILSGVDGMLCPYHGFDSQSGVAALAMSNGIPVIGTPSSYAGNTGGVSAAWPMINAEARTKDIVEAVRGFLKVPREQRLETAREIKQNKGAAELWRDAASKILGWHRTQS
ncbi:glycosyltransferase [Altererythrobacter ishigakiensis]|uniref:Glycosyltransferase involved in cell wall biosynthesis n=1 Tax=Altererythrobacter ishigakiensis TaxID=476157 RepID=A0A562USN3_9SPHN|nr:glycosyltransferase [Altererythrobacter ishigakiensis]TWJ08626.1 glycosyltransferase involved in cell wall biosynthesis [Altererythrobacter ishigakiensis]